MKLSNVLTWTAGLSTGLAVGAIAGWIAASRQWREKTEELNQEWKRLFDEQHRERVENLREMRRDWSDRTYPK